MSWNVAGRVRRAAEQAQRLAELDPDLICLQELTPTTLPMWRQTLLEMGYAGIEHGQPSGGERSRSLVVLTASRSAIEPIPIAGVPWPERVLAIRTVEGVEVLNVHSPISPKPNLAKVRTHEAIHDHLADPGAAHPRILCGDLNTPRKEHPDGRVWTFARDCYGRLRPERGERWDQAELSLIRGLEPYGFQDAFRFLHGLQESELSWEWSRWRGGYRLDHMIVSAQFTVQECYYEHAWRRDGLSDHSALISRVVVEQFA